MKKTRIAITIIVIIVILTLVGCIATYKYFTKDIKTYSTGKIFETGTYPRVDGSAITQNLSQAFKKAFTQDSLAKVSHSGTRQAYENLINGKVDFILATQPKKEIIELAKKAGIEFEIIPIAKEALVFYINEDNPVNNLTIDEIQKIYSGTITNWSSVGGKNEEITAYQRQDDSIMQEDMENLVMTNNKITDPKKENLKGNGINITNFVSDFDNSENSIGYSYYNYAATVYDYKDSISNNKIKFVKINNIEPSYETIRDGTYPLITNYYIIIKKSEKEGSTTRKLISAMLSDIGQSIVKEAGYVPLK